MVAPPKTNRKLRKERKNRAKKVCLLLFTTSTSFLTRRFSVPWYQKGQGCGAPQEGQVRVGRTVLSLGSVASHIRTSQKLSAAVSYHLCPLSLSSTAHELYAHADIPSLCCVRCDGPEFVRQYLQRLSTRCELGMRTCEIALGVHTTCRVS